jgi:hypothetical protein
MKARQSQLSRRFELQVQSPLFTKCACPEVLVGHTIRSVDLNARDARLNVMAMKLCCFPPLIEGTH